VADLRDDFDASFFRATISHGPRHLLMRKRIRRMGTEGHFRAENSLALKACTLSDEQMVEISLKRLLGDVKDLTAQMHTVRAI